MVEQTGESLDDRESEPESFPGASRIGLDAVELPETPAPPPGRDAAPRVGHLEADLAAATPAPDDDPSPVGVADRIGDEILHDARQQDGIAPDGEARGHHPQPQPLALRLRRELR